MTKHTKPLPRPGQRYQIAFDKIAATLAALPLIAAETGLNAEHLAHTEGWMSTLVVGSIGATLAAAAALPIAERAAAKGYWVKAAGLAVFFLIMLAVSFSTSVGRVGAKADGDVAGARGHNAQLELAREAYAAAKEAQAAECKSGRGSRCRAAEEATTAARTALAAVPAAKAERSMETRLAAATGLSIDTVALYQPLLLPLALPLGGFFFLAYGLAPRREAQALSAISRSASATTEKASRAPKASTAKKPAAKAQKAPRKKPQALPAPVRLIPAGAVTFDQRTAMRASV